MPLAEGGRGQGGAAFTGVVGRQAHPSQSTSSLPSHGSTVASLWSGRLVVGRTVQPRPALRAPQTPAILGHSCRSGGTLCLVQPRGSQSNRQPTKISWEEGPGTAPTSATKMISSVQFNGLQGLGMKCPFNGHSQGCVWTAKLSARRGGGRRAPRPKAGPALGEDSLEPLGPGPPTLQALCAR